MRLLDILQEMGFVYYYTPHGLLYGMHIGDCLASNVYQNGKGTLIRPIGTVSNVPTIPYTMDEEVPPEHIERVKEKVRVACVTALLK